LNKINIIDNKENFNKKDNNNNIYNYENINNNKNINNNIKIEKKLDSIVFYSPNKDIYINDLKKISSKSYMETKETINTLNENENLSNAIINYHYIINTENNNNKNNYKSKNDISNCKKLLKENSNGICLPNLHNYYFNVLTSGSLENKRKKIYEKIE
jgi:hypothetical protein